jgi:crotonobetainyl-CoA:carnitine CoA-transferase CaiB-like acyl-CoA transferase
VNPPLAGLTVVEIGQFIAAPYAALVLADLGARVVKVEPPSGDGIRRWGPHPGGESAPFIAYNRNKESVVADISTAAGAERVRSMVAGADVLIENNRPGVLDRFGLDPETVRAEHPALIYCSITGYGRNTPYADRPGFDLVIQGLTGLIDVTGVADGGLAKVPVPIVDGTAGLHAVAAILAAVHTRSRTGEGATLDISLHASTMSWMMLLAAGFFANGEQPARIGTAHPFAAPYQAFETADGAITIAAGNDRQWSRLCGALELDHLVNDPRFATNADRAHNQIELADIVESRLRLRPVAHWVETLNAIGVPCGPVNPLVAALEDPALVARGVVSTVEHPLAGSVGTIGNPIHWKGYESPLRRAPMLGEHNGAVAGPLDEVLP